MSYRNLEVWQLARDVTIEIHEMTLTKLPKFEMYEVGQQVRRSAKSIRANIVEGYGRRRYKQDFIRFLVIALASCDETRDHLEVLHDTKSLTDENTYLSLARKLDQLGKQLNNLVSGVDREHRSVRDVLQPYDFENGYDADQGYEDDESGNANPASSIQHLASDKNDLSHEKDESALAHPESSIQDPAS